MLAQTRGIRAGSGRCAGGGGLRAEAGRSAPTGQHLAEPSAVPNCRISYAPALAANEATGAQAILMRGTSGPPWVADHVNGSWQDDRTLPGTIPKDAPAAYFNNKRYTMCLS